MRIRLIVLLVGIVTACALAFAQAPSNGPVEHFTATTDNVGGAGDMVRFDVLSWSTDAVRDRLVSAWSRPVPPAVPPVPAAAVAPPLPATAPPADAAAAGGRGGARGGAAAGGRGGGGGGGRGGAAANAIPPETPQSALMAALQKLPSVGILWTSESAGYSLHYAYRTTMPDGGQRILFLTDRRLGSFNTQWKTTGMATATDYPFTLIELRFNAKGEGEGRASLTGKVVEDAAAKTLALDNYAAQPIVFKGVKVQNSGK